MPHLFDTFTLRGITLRNRIGLSPMCMYSYTNGFSNDWQIVHLGTRAACGVGLIIAEATAVEARGRITPSDVGIWLEKHIEPLARVSCFIKQQGAIPGIQIAHAGRKACVSRPWEGSESIHPNNPRGWEIVGPSNLPFDNGCQIPHELSQSEIGDVQDAFRAAAERALQAGFEWLEIHAAHGYLFHSFYSPISNRRTDNYGGSFENRIRFLVETTQEVRKEWPDRFPLTVRISGTDWLDGGWTVEESIELACLLKREGVDLIDCSSSGIVAHIKKPIAPGYQVPIAEAIRRGAQIPTAAVGLITDPIQADEIIHNERADLILLGRELLRDPHWAIHAAQALNQPLPVPSQYLQAF